MIAIKSAIALSEQERFEINLDNGIMSIRPLSLGPGTTVRIEFDDGTHKFLNVSGVFPHPPVNIKFTFGK